MDPVIHITGAGVVSAVGCGQGETLDALRRGASGIAPVRFLQTAETAFPVGEVKLSNAEMAERCGRSEKSVDNAIQRIRNKLARQISYPGDFS